MALLQGSSYYLPIKIVGANGTSITGDVVENVSFTIGGLTKGFADGVEFDKEKMAWIIPLTEDETFLFENTVEWQARFLFSDGRVDGTIPKTENVYDSINRVKLSKGDGDA